MTRLMLFLSLALAITVQPLVAAEYPDKPIKVVVGYAAGGATDVAARILANQLQKQLGAPVVVENRAGASGIIGSTAVAKAKPDGYTLLIGTSGSLTINIHLQSPAPFNPLSDLTPISMLIFNDPVLIVSNDVPAANFRELQTLLAKEPGKYSYATAGIGQPNHLVAERMNAKLGLTVVHVPYNGDAAAVQDVITGRVPLMFATIASVAGQIKSGAVRAIIGFGPQRFQDLPDIPSISETDPSLVGGSWLALMGPAGLPEDVVARLNKEIATALQDPEVDERLTTIGSRISFGTPAALAERLRTDYELNASSVKELGLK